MTEEKSDSAVAFITADNSGTTGNGGIANGSASAVRLVPACENGISNTEMSNVTMPSSPNRQSNNAIEISDAYKYYGGKTKANQTPVLLGLDMKVRKGQIYGLLGPSGCGKTTLLKCIVGKLKVDTGSVMVFGEPPGSGKDNGVPGPRVGYMPQELALFGEFNIEETLTYFRRLYGMTHAQYLERLDFLMKFLDLPSKKRALINMSGGQQRRASLAVALLHEPDLLILDEPTVGVDPLLRTSIWNHLLDITSSMGKHSTIVITTHYIEEARQAHRVGMMRFGKLLAEDSPENLLQKYSKPNLEDVFLELCLLDGDMETAKVRAERQERTPLIVTKHSKNKPTMSETAASNRSSAATDTITSTTASTAAASDNQNSSSRRYSLKKTSSKHKLPDYLIKRRELLRKNANRATAQRVNACMLKTFNRMKKRIGFLLYQFVLPALQVSLFCLAIGQDPKELPVAVVNNELSSYHPSTLSSCSNSTSFECPISFDSFLPEPNEHLNNFACRFLSFVDPNIAKLENYPDLASARKAVEDGNAWGVIEMEENFSTSLYDRIIKADLSLDDSNSNSQLFNDSSVKIQMDITNQHIAFTLQLKMAEAFQQFMEQLVTSCGLSAEIASIPLVFLDPIYGTKDLTFTDFMAPGIILTIVHSMALGYSAMIIIMERNEGLLDRTWVAGVTPGEFALAHFLVSLVVNLLQVLVTLAFMILVFQVPNEGSICLVFLLTMLQGIAGTTIGLIISAVCQTQQDATQVALGIFYPNLILSGVIWPIESMPLALRYISYVLPQTFACEAMRGILLRGWGLAYMPVWRGFAVTIAWIVVTYFIFKRLVGKA